MHPYRHETNRATTRLCSNPDATLSLAETATDSLNSEKGCATPQVYECVGTDLDRFEESVLAIEREFGNGESQIEVNSFIDISVVSADVGSNDANEDDWETVRLDSAHEPGNADANVVGSESCVERVEFDPVDVVSYMCEPPDKRVFDNAHGYDKNLPDGFEEMTAYMKQLANDQGFGIAKCNISRAKDGCRAGSRLTGGRYICDRGYGKGSYRIRNPVVKKQATTRNLDCPFEWRIRVKKGTCYTIGSTNVHNHPIGQDELLASPGANKLKPEHMKLISKMTDAGMMPAAIANLMRNEYPGIIIKPSTIYAARRRLADLRLGNNTHIQSLLNHAVENNFVQAHEVDKSGKLTRFFFAPPESVYLARRHPDVLIMDCTYKTNSPQVPLLNIVGIGASGKTFYAGFVFLAKETTEDYKWALRQARKYIYCDNGYPGIISTDCDQGLLNAISAVYPESANMLCQWHILSNIRKLYTKQFPDVEMKELIKAWQRVVYSHTQELFQLNWESMCEKYDGPTDVISYITKQWMPFKERFVVAWTKDFFNLGVGTSQRVESIHASLKRSWIFSSNIQLDTLAFRLTNAVRAQVIAHKTDIVTSRSNTLTVAADDSFFKNVSRRVSLFALLKVYALYKQARELVGKQVESIPCTRILRRTMGIPCVHELHDRLRSNGALSVADFHTQWRLCSSYEPGKSIVDARITLNQKLQELIELAKRAEGAEVVRLIHIVDDALHGPNVPVLNPVKPGARQGKANTRGRSKKKGCSTRRDPTGAEHAEREKATSAQPSSKVSVGRICGACKKPGHISTNRMCEEHPHYLR